MNRLFSGYGKWFIFINAVVITAMAYMFMNGWLDVFIREDTREWMGGISLVFLWGWICSWVLLWQTGARKVSKARLQRSIERVGFVTIMLGMLGLIGTVWGFSKGVSGANLVSVSVENVEAVKALLVSLASGAAIALHTTILGASCALYLNTQLMLLEWRVTDK